MKRLVISTILSVVIMAAPTGAAAQETFDYTRAADASYRGASGGTPRNLDIPQNRINDVRGMVDYISTYPGVDASRIGALGICGGGGYTYAAFQPDKRIKAGATLSLFNTGRIRRLGYQDSQMASVQEHLKRASDAREKYVLTGETAYEGPTGTQTRQQIEQAMSHLQPGTLYHDGLEYYGITHVHPNSVSSYTTASLMDLMMWDATDRADLIDCPLLIMSGSKSDSDYMSREAYIKAGNTVEMLNINDYDIRYFAQREYDREAAAAETDDAAAIIAKMKDADVIVLSSPVYFYNITRQLKTLIDRTYGHEKDLSNKEFFYIAISTDKGEEAVNSVFDAFHGFAICLFGSVEHGAIGGNGARNRGDIDSHPAMQHAYEMGKGV